jgi:hypothetical protein
MVMNDAKPLASLSSSLLARKGHARPAMRPQSMLLNHDAAQSLEDLGWNDLGEEEGLHKAHLATVNALTPMGSSPANEQQADLARFYGQDEGSDTAEEASSPDWCEEVIPDALAMEGQSDQAEVQAESVIVPMLADPQQDHAVMRILRAAPGSKAKAAFTLRLDPDRHLRLRLCAAVSHRSAQMIVTQALDEFLDRQMPNTPFSSPLPAA